MHSISRLRIRSRLQHTFTLLLASLLATAGTPTCAGAAPLAADILLLALAVNGQEPSPPVAVARTREGEYLLSDEAVHALHLQVQGAVGVDIDGQRFFTLGQCAVTEAQLEAATQVLKLTIPATAFSAGRYDQRGSGQIVTENSALGAFLNYDLFVQDSRSDHASGLFEGGVLFPKGTLLTRYVVDGQGPSRSVTRLDTHYEEDFPEHTATLIVGDSTSGPSSWGRSVYFGGLQWATNYGTRPDLSPLPLPSISGSAAVPSTVDLYVDNVLRGHQQVEAGPFTLSNIPILTEEGNLTLVVHDALGHQQLFEQNYISSPSLLAAGSLSFSSEAGLLRNNFGTANASYGAGFLSGTVRYGTSAYGTLELHAESSSDVAAIGLGSSRGLTDIGVVSIGSAASTSQTGPGGLIYAQFDRDTANYGLALRAQLTSAGFRQLGLDAAEGAPRATSQVQFSAPAGAHGTLLVGLTQELNRGANSFRAINAGFNFSLARFGSLFAGVISSFQPSRSVSANLVWTIPIGDVGYLQAATNTARQSSQSTVEFDSVVPPELGWSYRLRQSTGSLSGTDVGVSARAQTGDYSLSASNVGGINAVQFEARGGIVLMGGEVVATKWLNQSFALVTVPTTVPVDIYANNIKVGQTDSHGIGFIPNLVPFEQNHVALDGRGLPLQMTMDLSVHNVVPRRRAGVIVAFKVEAAAPVTLTLVDQDGSALANGTEVHAVGQDAVATVALRGQAYFPNLHLPARLEVKGPKHCIIDVPAAAANDALPTFESLRCATP